MWFDDLLAPNGPQAPAVYWFRRAGLLVVVFFLLWLIWPSGGGSSPKKPAAHTPITTLPSSPGTASSPAASTAGTCQANDLALSADADNSDYTAGKTPTITISIRNNGASPCTLPTAQRYLTITSGTDLWYSSQACQTGTQVPVSIGAGQTVTSSYVWNRKRQAKDCTVGGAAPDGTYLAKAHFGSKETQGAVIRLHG